MNAQDLKAPLETAVRAAGQIVSSHFNGALKKHTKPDGSFATQADLESEQYLIKELGALIPGSAFYAEESGITSGNEYCWVIDPLDGTTNFAQGIPYFCISVGLTRNGERIAGAIYQPTTDEFFYAFKGQGAFLNDKPLKKRGPNTLEDAVIGCALSYKVDHKLYNTIGALEPKVYSVRILGAAALDIAYCASNRFDGALFSGLSWWDIAAGSLILEEAGGVASTLDGGLLNSDARSFLGGSKLIFEELNNLL